MTELVNHPLTERQLSAFAEAPPHAIILVGPTGSGKTTLAERLAEQALGLGEEGLENYPYLLRLSTHGSIGIEAVRELEHFLSLRVPRQNNPNRAVLIESAETLTLEAQNALLKTLEEPPDGTMIILTATHERALLPTIVSRAQLLPVRRPEKQAATAFFAAQKHDDKTIEQAYMMSGGLPGLMNALLAEAEHPLVSAAQRVRQLLQQTSYERLLQVDELAKDKVATQNLLFILQQMAHVSLQSAQGQAAKRWQGIAEACYHTSESFQQNGQPKLVLTKLMLGL
jgi:replication-associated recombination protein RarA